MCAIWRDLHRPPTGIGDTGGNTGAWHTFAIWRDRHRLPTSVRATGDNTGAGHAFAIWRDQHRLPVSVSVHTGMRYSASAVFRNHRILEIRLVVGMLQRRGYKDPITRAATPPKLKEQVQDGVLIKNVTKFSSMPGGVYGNLAERVFDIDTAQHDAGNHAMSLAEVQNPSTKILEDATKLTRWGSGEISIVIHT